MFDLFGTNKMDAQESVEVISKGLMSGIMNSVFTEMDIKEEAIVDLKKRIDELNETIAKLAKELNDIKKPEDKNVQKTNKR